MVQGTKHTSRLEEIGEILVTARSMALHELIDLCGGHPMKIGGHTELQC